MNTSNIEETLKWWMFQTSRLEKENKVLHEKLHAANNKLQEYQAEIRRLERNQQY
jgi:uncharacterized phage infection (PIP) family protein YhgE